MTSSFKIGANVKVGFDRDLFARTGSRFWYQNENDRERIVRVTANDPSRYPWGIMPYVDTGALALIIRNDRTMHLHGQNQRITAEAVPDSTLAFQYVAAAQIWLETRPLNDAEIENLSSYTGYPVEIGCKSVRHLSIPDDLWFIGSFNPFMPLINNNTFVPFLLRCWLGEFDRSTLSFPLVDHNGDTLMWPNNNTLTENVVAGGDNKQWPSFAEDRHTLIVGEAFYRSVFKQRADGSYAGVNGIANISGINKPGRVDFDAYTQPQTIPANQPSGPFELRYPIFNNEEPDYDADSFRATVVSSVIEPQVIEEFTGITIENSRHDLILDVSDRHSASLDVTPQNLNSPLFPQFEILGRKFFFKSMVETSGNTVVLELSSNR